MKKLMIALVAAAAAFGLRAENADPGFISGSDFEIENLDATYWTAADGAATLTEGAHTVAAGYRPTQWKLSDNTTNLVIKTTLGSPVTQKIQPAGTKAIGTGVYFDGLVNLTVFDVEDTPPAADLEGAKLGVYLQLANEDESATNFVVVAKGDDGAKAYVCADADLTPGWHRLTIKAIANIYNEGAAAANAGFVVFVDNNAVSCTSIEGITAADLTPNAKLFFDNGRLFASIGGANDELTSIQYDGQGVIDEVAFTTVAPFAAAADTDFVQVTWTAANVTTMTIGGKTYEGGTAYAPITYSGDPAVAQPIEVAWVGAGNYVDGSFTITTPSASTPVDLDDQMAEAAATFNDGATVTKLESIKAAVDKAALSDGTIKLLADAGEDETIEFESEKDIVLDLNGHTVNDVTGEAGSLTYDNTSETKAVIEGTADIEATMVTTNVKINFEANNDDGVYNGGAEAPAGYEFVRVEDYWELKEEQTAIDIATCTIADVTAVYGTAVTNLVITDEANDKTLAKDTDYTLDFGDYTAETAAGTVVTVTVTGINDYKGTTTKTFTVAAKAVTPTITFDPADTEVTWVKGGQLPTVTVVAEGTTGTDYTEGWADGPQYPAENPKEAVVFTYTVTMRGNYSGEATKTFTVNPAETVVVPGGAPVVVTKEEAEKLEIKATAPADSGVTDVDYSKYFKKQIVELDGGKVSVTAVLDEEAIEFAESAADLGEQIGAIAAGEGEATIAAKPGLYYYVEEANDVTKIAEPERDRVMATGDEVTVPTTKFENSGFYRLNVSTVQRGIVTGQ